MSPAITKMDQKVEESPDDFSKISKTKKVPDKNERKGKKSMEMQPHLEQQLRIARLIDNGNKEDPKLKEKLKKIVEATQKSLDEAYTALHDCDYDINRAVNKLLEEDNTEWSTLSKKKKSRELKDEQVNDVEPPNCDVVPSRVTRGGYPRGRGRGGQGRWMQSPREARSSPGRRVFTNSTLEARTQEMLEANRPTRTAPVIRPVDNWDPNRPVSNLLTKGRRNDAEDEEYSGSLSRGLVFTSSNFGRHHNNDWQQNNDRQQNNAWQSNNERQPKNDREPNIDRQQNNDWQQNNDRQQNNGRQPNNDSQPNNDREPIIDRQQNHDRKLDEGKQQINDRPQNNAWKPSNEKLPKNDREPNNDGQQNNGRLMSKIQQPQIDMTESSCLLEVVTDKLKVEEETVSLVAENAKISQQELPSNEDLSLTNSSSAETLPKPNVGMRAPPMTASVLKVPPRADKTPICRRTRSSSIPLSSVNTRKPITPVEMPPDSDGGSIELLDITFGAIDLDEHTFDVIPKCDSSSETLFSNKPPLTLKPAFRNQKEKSSIENLRFAKDFKMDNRYYESSYPKVPQKSKSYINPPMPGEAETSIMTQVSSMPYTTSAGLHTSPMPQVPYFNPQSSQQLSYYQSVLAGPTYTTNSQYGSSGLSSPSYSVPYQTYSSMVQGHKPAVSQSFSNELDSIANSPVTSMNYPGVPTSSYSMPLETGGKTNPQGKNMPAYPQVVLGQTGMTYYQATPLYFPDMQMIQQARASPYYEYPGSPPRDPAFHHPEQLQNVVYGDTSTMPPPFPTVCMTPTESANRNLKPPSYQLPPVYRGEKPVPAPSQARSYN